MNNKSASVTKPFLHSEAPPALDYENAEQILKSIKIPPQPLTLISLKKELSKENVNNNVISDIIRKDITVAAGVIKTINSPFFCLQNKIDNIQRAVTLLGTSNIVNIVNSFSLKEALQEYDIAEMDEYLDFANDIALVAAGLAKDLGVMDMDVAYTLGLFHDVGIPLLLQKFPNYAEVLQYAYASNERSLTEIEDDNIDTNHAVVGYYVCKAWNMPEEIGLAILNHHNIEEVLMADSDQYQLEVKTSVALLTMAEYIAYAYQGAADRTKWVEESPTVLGYLDLDEQEFDLIKATMFEKLGD